MATLKLYLWTKASRLWGGRSDTVVEFHDARGCCEEHHGVGARLPPHRNGIHDRAMDARCAHNRGGLPAIWTDDGMYVDAHRRGTGHDGIASMMGTQAQFPGYRLQLVSGIEAHNGYVRFSWASIADYPLFPLCSLSTTSCILSRRSRIPLMALRSSHAPSTSVRPGSSRAFILSHSSASICES
jgi:hypothetical protein